MQERSSIKGIVFDIQRFSIQDGPGIRTTVFLKGCPLRCLWCSNPESQKFPPELFFSESLCVRCHRCVEVCPTGATELNSDGTIQINYELCKACGECVKVCPSGARTTSGKLMSIEEVLDMVKKDSLFYRNSGGGVTASGGEPLYQPDFLIGLFKECQEAGIQTALDTSGYARWETIEKILGYVDLVLFDIKHMDSEKHKEYTGVDNKLILRNAEKLAQERKPLIIRVPLIPGYNDSEENIMALARFMRERELVRIDLLCYHQFGRKKYEMLGREYKLSGVNTYKDEEVQMIKEELESFRLDVSIVG